MRKSRFPSLISYLLYRLHIRTKIDYEIGVHSDMLNLIHRFEIVNEIYTRIHIKTDRQCGERKIDSAITISRSCVCVCVGTFTNEIAQHRLQTITSVSLNGHVNGICLHHNRTHTHRNRHARAHSFVQTPKCVTISFCRFCFSMNVWCVHYSHISAVSKQTKIMRQPHRKKESANI